MSVCEWSPVNEIPFRSTAPLNSSDLSALKRRYEEEKNTHMLKAY